FHSDKSGASRHCRKNFCKNYYASSSKDLSEFGYAINFILFDEPMKYQVTKTETCNPGILYSNKKDYDSFNIESSRLNMSP
ncbi:MAG: hypothetical protein ACXWV9_06565, partial [Flavisolibacter sp.]